MYANDCITIIVCTKIFLVIIININFNGIFTYFFKQIHF